MLGNILVTAVNAVVPIVLLILLGYILKQKGFINDAFVRIGNKLVFNICLPCMLFINVYDIDGISSIRWDVVIFSVVIICILFVLGLVTAVATTKVPERRGVILQCVFRSNYAIIGMSLVETLGGTDAAAVAAVVSAFTIPLFNVFAVISLTLFVDEGGTKKEHLRHVLSGILHNPLIWGVVLGLGCLGIRQLQTQLLGEVVFALNQQTKFLYSTLHSLKAIASPLAMIVLGGGFVFSAVKGLFKEIAVSTLWRLVLAPCLGLGAAIVLSTYTDILSCGPGEYATFIALFGSPVAVSSAVMASNMKNDEQLAAQLVVWTSIGSVFTVFLQVCILMVIGLM